MELNKIYNIDCLKGMKSIDDESIDLVITSPPYNLLNTTGGGLKSGLKDNKKWNFKTYDFYDDNLPKEEYIEWQRNCLFEMLRIIKPNGAIFYNHKWRVQGGLIEDRREILEGFPVRQIIIWDRGSGFLTNPSFFIPSYEVIYLITKPKFKLFRNGERDVWKIDFERKSEHPAPFPVALVEKILKSTFSEIVLDPFMGSGTVAVACIKNEKKYIGFEISKKYYELAKNRIKKTEREIKYKKYI